MRATTLLMMATRGKGKCGAATLATFGVRVMLVATEERRATAAAVVVVRATT